MIIVFDGPEKAGKTTLIAALQAELVNNGYKVAVRKWGRAEIDDREYAPALREDNAAKDVITLWDRSWVSEHIYGKMLSRHCRLATDPWLGEWLHTRAVSPSGLNYIVLPEHPVQTTIRRDSTDLPVDPTLEYITYLAYANHFHWPVIRNNYTKSGLYSTIERIVTDIYCKMPKAVSAPYFSGQVPSFGQKSVVFVLSKVIDPKMAEKIGIPGSWLHLTTSRAISFARQYDPFILGAGATDIQSVTPAMIEGASCLVVIGGLAFDYLFDEHLIAPFQKVITIGMFSEYPNADVDYALRQNWSLYNDNIV